MCIVSDLSGGLEMVVHKEIWKTVEGYPGYEVSNFGRVRSVDRIDPHGGYRPRKLKGRLLKQKIQESTGYSSVSLCGRTFRVHRLVATAFCGRDRLKAARCVRHLDHDKLNNHASNLCWGSYKDNAQDTARVRQVGHKLNARLVVAIRTEYDRLAYLHRRQGQGGRYGQLAKKFPGVGLLTLRAVVTRRTWKYV